VAQRLGLCRLHLEVGVEHVAQEERLGAAGERQDGAGEEQEERAGVEEGGALHSTVSRRT
jgi:hypothetical protein